MPSITLSKEFMLEDVLYNPQATILRNVMSDQSRWSTSYDLVFLHEGKTYETYYSRGSTEQQDEGPWENEDEVECFEVEAYTKTVTDYRRV